VVKAICYKAKGRGFETLRGELNCFNLPNPSARTGVYSISDRNEYERQKNNVSR
jgi:hypothetical protein